MVKKCMRIGDVAATVGRSRSWIYSMIKVGKFPKPLHMLGTRSVVWTEDQIAEWQSTALVPSDAVKRAA